MLCRVEMLSSLLCRPVCISFSEDAQFDQVRSAGWHLYFHHPHYVHESHEIKIKGSMTPVMQAKLIIIKNSPPAQEIANLVPRLKWLIFYRLECFHNYYSSVSWEAQCTRIWTRDFNAKWPPRQAGRENLSQRWRKLAFISGKTCI